MTAKLDVYSDLAVPFDIATWCRGHKFSPAAVEIARSLKRRDELRAKLAELESQIEAEEAGLAALVQTAREKMDTSKGA